MEEVPKKTKEPKSEHAYARCAGVQDRPFDCIPCCGSLYRGLCVFCRHKDHATDASRMQASAGASMGGSKLVRDCSFSDLFTSISPAR